MPRTGAASFELPAAGSSVTRKYFKRELDSRGNRSRPSGPTGFAGGAAFFAHAVAVAFFSVLKLSQPAADGVARVLGWCHQLVSDSSVSHIHADATDLIALGSVPLAYVYGLRRTRTVL